MPMVANWLLQNLWVELALGCTVGFALAVPLVYLQHLARQKSKERDEELLVARERRQRFLMFCTDAKVITDLAMQRYMSDVQFLQSFRAQPCFDELFPFFSEEFRELLAQEPGDHANKAFLAVACHAEVTRLEATPDPVRLAPSERFDHKHGLSFGERVTIAIERHVETDVLAEPQRHEVQKL
jgi:hypothetical protein